VQWQHKRIAFDDRWSNNPSKALKNCINVVAMPGGETFSTAFYEPERIVCHSRNSTTTQTQTKKSA